MSGHKAGEVDTRPFRFSIEAITKGDSIMVSQQTLKGHWNEISGKLRSKWGELSNDELQKYQGDATQLVGYIQRKTGATRDQIERFLNDLADEGAGVVGRAAETVQDYASRAAQSAKEGADAVMRQAQSGYAAAERIVQERPATSVAAAFGAGLITGVMLALLLGRER
jgi:uncharacterized protein YjbJ (UPF0337 family)